jgi:RHO1 GDP-GTP exchange protein 1/2
MMDPPIIPREQLDSFMDDVFHNIQELYSHHRRLVKEFQSIRREEQPTVQSFAAAMYDMMLTSRDAYFEYVYNYPIAEFRIYEELKTNPAFKKFHRVCSLKQSLRFAF